MLIVYLFGISSSLELAIYGHEFVPNESASFLSFANQLKTESGLVETNLADGNTDLAKEHATRAVELVSSKDPVNNVTWKEEIAEKNQRVADDLVAAISGLANMNISSSSVSSKVTNQSVSDIYAIIDEAITSRIDKEQRDNATVQATALGDTVNALLGYYGDAFSVGFDMGNMSQMATGMEGASSNKNYSLVNVTDYQSSQALAKMTLEIFDNDLNGLASTNRTDSVSKLEVGLHQLNDSIDNKSSPIEVMTIGHTQVHPNLQAAFNLKLQMMM